MSEVTNIREKLSYGTIKKIHQKTGVSYGTINRVLDGKSDNINVLNAIAEILHEQKTAKATAMKKIQAAFNH